MASEKGGSVMGSKGNKSGINDEDEELDHKASLEMGVFGVLFTLSKEKSDTIKFTIVKSLLDLDQLFITVVDPSQGWDIDPHHLIWRIVNVMNFQWLKDRGYDFFVALLYCMVGALAANLALCIWVAIAFQRRQFDHVWPVRVLRVFTSIFFQFFDVASLNLLQVALSCQYVGAPDGLQGHLMIFPDVECKSLPHLIHAIVSAAALIVFVMIALLLNMSEVELNPSSKRPMALGHSGPEVLAFFIKFLMTMVNVFIPWNRVQGGVLSFLSLWLLYTTLRWVPNMVGWANHVKVAIYTSILYCSLMLCLLAFHPGMDDMTDDFSHKVTVAMLAGLPALLIVGFLLSYLRIRWFCNYVQNKFSNMDSDTKLVDVYEFQDPRDVEIAARIMRRWEPRGKELLPESVAEAEVILRAGLAKFPHHAYMSLLYANFMIEVGGNSSTGYRHLETVGTQQPSIMCRFMVFVREQEQQQRSASSGNGRGTLDLVSYVEYQKNQRLVLRHHRDALMAVCNFWKSLNHSKIPFTTLSRELHNIETCMVKAEQAYKMALDRHPSSVKLLALYAKFLEHVKNDPWKAAEYYAEVEKMEEKQAEEGTTLAGQNGETMKVDDKNNPVIVIDASGKMTMCNKAAHRVFGYEKGEMEGKQINMCMPQPFASKHNSYLRHYLETGEERVVNKVRNVVVLHKDRYVFPVRLMVTRASGTGQTSTFMGVMEIPPRDEHTMTSHAWVTPNGVIVCIDAYFSEWFGHEAGDMIGSPLHKYLSLPPGMEETPERVVMRLVEQTSITQEMVQRTWSSTNVQEMINVAVNHKFGDPLVCQLTAMAAGTPTTPITQFMFKRSRAEGIDLMLVSDSKGAINHISSNLASMLGYSNPQVVMALKLHELMMHPWNFLHPRWIQKDQDEDMPPAQGCRGGNLTVCMQDARGKPVPVRMAVRSSDESGNLMHIVRVNKSSQTQAQLDRSLQLTVTSHGTIVEVSETTPDTLFNVKPQALLGMHLGACLKLTGDPDENSVLESMPDEFHGMVENPELPSVLKVLNAMVKRAMREPGTSWRVAVVPPGEEEDIRARTKDPLVAATLLAEVMQPAVMQVEVTRPPRSQPPRRNADRPRRESNTGLIVPNQTSNRGAKLAGINEAAAAVAPGTPASPVNIAIPVQTLFMKQVDTMYPSSQQAVSPTSTGAFDTTPHQLPLVGPTAFAKDRVAPTSGCISINQSGPVQVARAPIVQQESGLMIKVTLWRADLLAGLLELDKDGTITGVVDRHIYPVGLLFGTSHKKMKGSKFNKFIHASSVAELTSEPGEKKSALKMAAAKNTLGTVRRVSGVHVDGCPLGLTVQTLSKGGANGMTTLVLRLDRPSRGDRAVFQALLTERAISRAPSGASLGGGLRRRALVGAVEIGDALARAGVARSVASFKSHKSHRSVVPAPQAAGLAGEKNAGARRFRFAGSDDEGESSQPMDGDGGEAAPSPQRLGVTVGDDEDTVDAADARQQSGVAKDGGDYAGPRKPAAAPTSEEGEEEDEEEEVMTAAQQKKLQNVAHWVESAGEEYVNHATTGGPMVYAAGAEGKEIGLNGLLAGAGAQEGGKLRRRNSVDASPMDDAESGAALRFNNHANNADAMGGGNAAAAAGEAALLALDGKKPARTSSPSGMAPAVRKPSQGLTDDDNSDPLSPPLVEKAPPKMQAARREPPPPLQGQAEDAASEASSGDSGQSGMSGMSGTSGFTDVDDERADYRRAKRFKKLAGMLDSTQAQAVTRRFRRSAIGIVLATSVLHIICFAFVLQLVDEQMAGVKDLYSTGRANQAVMNIVIASRALDQIHKGYGAAGLYTCQGTTYNTSAYYLSDCADIKKYETVLDDATTQFRSDSDAIYMSKGSTGAMTDKYGLQTLFDDKPLPIQVHWNYSSLLTERSLWLVTNDIFDSGREVLHQHMTWSAKGASIGSSFEFNYLLENAPDTFFETFHDVMRAMMEEKLANVDSVANVIYIIMAVEVTAMSAAGLVFAYLLRQVAVQRYSLYGVFLIIPQGLTRALATQTVQLLEDEGSDNEGGQRPPEEQNEQENEAVGEDIEGNAATLSKKGSKDSSRRGASRAVDGSDSLKARGSGAAYNPKTSSNRSKRQSDSYTPGAPKGGALSWLLCCFGGNSAAAMAARAAGGGKRQLIYNSRENWVLLTPMYLWAVLVIIIYVLSAVWLHADPDAVALNSVIAATYGGMLKMVLEAQELCRQGSDAGTLGLSIAQRKAMLAATAEETMADYLILLQGEGAPNATEWPRVIEPVTNHAPAVSSVIYDTRECLRSDHQLCFETNSTYYEVTHNGVNTMMMRLFREVRDLVATPDDQIGGLANPHLAWIWNVGLGDLQDGMLLVADMHSTVSVEPTQRVRTMHIVFLALCILFNLAYIVTFLKPALKRMSHERRRIAELLSQLPNELNVEKLVLVALGNKKPKGNKVAPENPNSPTPDNWKEIVKLQRTNSAAQASLRMSR